MQDFDWTKIITAVVAVYGAVMSTVTFCLNRKEKKRTLNVSFSNGFLVNGPETSDAMLFIDISNPGNRVVTINIPRIVLPNKKTLVFPNYQSDVRYPYKLEEGTSCKTWIEIRTLVKQLKMNGFSGIVKLMADVEDGAGTKYKSKNSYDLDLNAWNTDI